MNHFKNLTLSIIGNGRTKVLNTDDHLMQRFQAGDQDAFTFLVHRHKQKIFRFILSKVKDTELASDLTQDVFVKLFRSADSYQPAGKFQSWLFRMAQNICIDAYRKTRGAPILSLRDKNEHDRSAILMEELEAPMPDPEKETEYLDLCQFIEQAFDTLPEKQRAAVVLCQYYGMSYSEIAAIQQVPVGTVKSRIHNGLLKVKEFFMDRGLLE